MIKSGWLLFVGLILTGCGHDDTMLLPGERYTIDTLLAKQLSQLESKAMKECDRRRDSVFRTTYDSLFKARAADIQLIRKSPVAK